jgi:hypothetical protein
MTNDGSPAWLRELRRSRLVTLFASALVLVFAFGLGVIRLHRGETVPLVLWFMAVGAPVVAVIPTWVAFERAHGLRDSFHASAHVVRHLNKRGREGTPLIAVISLSDGVLHLMADSWDGSSYLTLSVHDLEVVNARFRRKVFVRVRGADESVVLLCEAACVRDLRALLALRD